MRKTNPVEPYWEEQRTSFEIDFSQPGEFGWVLYATVQDATQGFAEKALWEIREKNRIENPGVKFRLAKVTRSVYHEGF